ncbi:MAG: hypothetical protein RMI94_13010 [Bryobacterales bacterium]|nr:hypothetical protein [Bryobacteraceae bacterium]MDW8131463.1 hypothetical protein [Bryobacterales bacterium]
MTSPPWSESPLIAAAGPLWPQATRSPFLDAAAAGTLPEEAFHRWLAQDYLFARGLTAYQAIALAKAPRDAHRTLIDGLVALDRELEWFESHAQRRGLSLAGPPHPVCRAYVDFLMRNAYTSPWPLLAAILFGVEASYLAAWSALTPAGPYAEFIERWSNAAFVSYVNRLAALATRYPHPEAQRVFDQVLIYEREFWQMAWEG